MFNRAAGCLLAGIMAAAVQPAAAQELFAHALPLSDAEMGDLRGGFTVAGMEFNFAVEVRTTFQNAMNETVGLVTSITFDDHGPASQSRTVGSLPEGVTSVTPGPRPGSVTASLDTGATRILHDVSPSKLQTIISNTASNVTVNQDMTVDVVSPSFGAVAQDFTAAFQLRNLGDLSAQFGLGNR